MGHEKHPVGLYPLFLTEMWERFSFYLMLGILPLYLTDSQKGGLGMSDSQMAVVVGSYMALVYFTPFIGGLIADRLLGLRRTILIGGFLMMCGQFVLAMPSTATLYIGMGLLILGNGAFKPNISSILGNLYPPGSPLKDAGYNIFYMGINIGAFICNFIAAFVRNYFDKYPLHLGSGLEIRGWHAAFSTGGFGMFLGIIIFSSFYRLLGAGETSRRGTPNPEARLTPLWVQCLTPAVVLGAIAGYATYLGTTPDYAAYLGWIPERLHLNVPTAAFLGACIPVVIFYLNIWWHVPDTADRGRVGALLYIYAVVIVFWMTFQLNSTALTIWARDDTNRTLAGPMQTLTEKVPQLGENAPPAYFANAGPDVPRPDRSSFIVVSPEEYQKREKQNQLTVAEDEKVHVYVTQKMLDEVYTRATTETPILPPGEPLKLANTELFQSINAGFVILFTPLIVAFWRKLRERGREPSSSAKIGFGLLLTAGAPLLMLAATWISDDGAVKTSAWWLFGVYGVITLGELCLSPMGLSLVNKMAPASITAFMMGGWFLSTSIGGKLSGIFGEAYSKMDHRQFWIILIICDLVCAGIIFVTLPWLNRQMAGRGEAPKA